MKKVFTLLAVAAAFTFTSCGGGEEANNEATPETNDSTEVTAPEVEDEPAMDADTTAMEMDSTSMDVDSASMDVAADVDGDDHAGHDH